MKEKEKVILVIFSKTIYFFPRHLDTSSRLSISFLSTKVTSFALCFTFIHCVSIYIPIYFSHARQLLAGLSTSKHPGSWFSAPPKFEHFWVVDLWIIREGRTDRTVFKLRIGLHYFAV